MLRLREPCAMRKYVIGLRGFGSLKVRMREANVLLTVLDSFLISGLFIIVLLGLVEAIAQIGGASFLGSVILRQDNRTSTSKTFVFMWTLLVGWALLSLFIVGELVNVHVCAG